MDLSLLAVAGAASAGFVDASHAVRKQTDRVELVLGRQGGRELERGHYPGIKWDHRRRCAAGYLSLSPMGFVSFAWELTPPRTAQVSE